jgi:hypothetical protein
MGRGENAMAVGAGALLAAAMSNARGDHRSSNRLRRNGNHSIGPVRQTFMRSTDQVATGLRKASQALPASVQDRLPRRQREGRAMSVIKRLPRVLEVAGIAVAATSAGVRLVSEMRSRQASSSQRKKGRASARRSTRGATKHPRASGTTRKRSNATQSGGSRARGSGTRSRSGAGSTSSRSNSAPKPSSRASTSGSRES